MVDSRPVGGPLRMPVSRHLLTRGLVAGAGMVALLSIVADAVSVSFGGRPNLARVLGVFIAGQEANVPTWYASFLLLSAALAIGLLARAIRLDDGPRARHWRMLAALFVFLSIDESAVIHEKLNLIGGQMILAVGAEPTGVLRYPWVVPGALLVGAFAVAYLPLLAGLPWRHRRLVVAAGLLYVGGALGMELVAARFPQDTTFSGHVLRIGIQNLEELLELAGVILLIHVVLGMLEERAGPLVVTTVAPRRAG